MAMRLFDVNVMVQAHRADMPRHGVVRAYLDAQTGGSEPFGMSELALSGFIRLTTNPRIFKRPTPLDEALGRAEAWLARPNCVRVLPGPRHFGLFADLCRRVRVRGNDITDAYYAALALEHGCRWVSGDRGFARFPGLDWATPEADAAGQP